MQVSGMFIVHIGAPAQPHWAGNTLLEFLRHYAPESFSRLFFIVLRVCEQVEAFVDKYMPSYQAYLPSLYARGPTTARAGRLLTVEVDANREPIADQPPPVQFA